MACLVFNVNKGKRIFSLLGFIPKSFMTYILRNLKRKIDIDMCAKFEFETSRVAQEISMFALLIQGLCLNHGIFAFYCGHPQ